MNEWILRVCVVGLITTVVLLILPQGRMSKYIKAIFSVMVAISIFSPVLDFDFSEFNNVFDIQTEQVSHDENYLNYIHQKRIKEQEKNLNNILLNLGIINAKANIVYHVKDNCETEIDKVIINLENAVYKSSTQNINITKELKRIVADFLMIDERMVEINE